GGPTRIGHYFRPAYSTAKASKGDPKRGPVIVPGKTYEWTLAYDPAANGGQGAIQVSLGKDSITLPLKEGHKAQGSRFDRFGLLTSYPGGQFVRIFFDDLKYSASRPAR